MYAALIFDVEVAADAEVPAIEAEAKAKYAVAVGAQGLSVPDLDNARVYCIAQAGTPACVEVLDVQPGGDDSQFATAEFITQCAMKRMNL